MKLLTVQEASKLLGISSKKLFSFLRENDFLTSSNLPHNQHLANGFFEIKHRSWIHPRDGLRFTGRTMITPRGVSHIDFQLRQQKTETLRTRDCTAANEGGTNNSTRKSA